MAWTSPITFAAGSTLTAGQLNTYLRDNLNETAPAKATTVGRIFAATGANAIAEREIGSDFISTSQTTTSTAATDLATVGPQVTVTTGTQAIVGISCTMSTNVTDGRAFMGFAVSGATSISANDWLMIMHSSAGVANRVARLGIIYRPTLTAGSNVFTAKYKVAGTAPTGTFLNRRMFVIAL